MANITGGCLCGRVRYTVTGEPAFSGLCHCRNCQRYTGSAFEALIAFPAASISVQGELKTYDDTGDSGQPVHRRFCPNCGSGGGQRGGRFTGRDDRAGGHPGRPSRVQANYGCVLEQRSAVGPPQRRAHTISKDAHLITRRGDRPLKISRGDPRKATCSTRLWWERAAAGRRRRCC